MERLAVPYSYSLDDPMIRCLIDDLKEDDEGEGAMRMGMRMR